MVTFYNYRNISNAIKIYNKSNFRFKKKFNFIFRKIIKIQENKNNEEYQNIINLSHSNWVYSLLLLEDKNI